MSRIYIPNEKHKFPKGWGSICPQVPLAERADLLGQAIAVANAGQNKLWTARGRWCFCGHPSGTDSWHGFPIIGGQVPEPVLIALTECGQISEREARQLRKQRELPESWP